MSYYIAVDGTLCQTLEEARAINSMVNRQRLRDTIQAKQLIALSDSGIIYQEA